MINIRFHIVSLVAVFLALGVGVTMGASFIDRATVDTMRGRVDDLETGFRDRGDRLDDYQRQLATEDSVAAALTEPQSRATDGSLTDVPVVLVVPSDLPEGSAELLTSALRSGGAAVSGTVRLQATLDPFADGGEPSDEELAALADAVGEPAERGDELPSLALLRLAQALAELSAAPPGGDVPTPPGEGPGAPTATTTVAGPTPTPSEPTTTTTTAAPDGGPGSTGELPSVQEARALLERYSAAGLLAVDSGGLQPVASFPAVIGVRYVMVVGPASAPGPDLMVTMAAAYGDLAPATMVVAAVEITRDDGAAPTTAEGRPSPTELLAPLRSGAASDSASTVDDATEPLARLAVVYAVAAQIDGIVGHYGTGEGATAPFPPVADG